MTSGADAWLVDERWFKAYPLITLTTIGRSGGCAIILRDPAVSRVHAEIESSADGYVLRPIGSSGTKLNSNRIESDVLLREGDVIEIASSTLRFTQKAPTGEMFLVSRDYPTSVDRFDPPTRATLHAMHPITLMSRARVYWRRVLVVLLILAMLLLVLGAGCWVLGASSPWS